ncbi:heat repeat-containing protein : Uncharacterized protein OS=Pseudanabaena biceps PCC 7429 GN=Pse7429DRAFT_3714 PE=4 SV=1: DUF4132 [Gemmataceae bacterium]|nr:heat repeat-containing protein : Uncharacterized protein OS=Pseudanabaena biceps PCC 7429 GN=Pse7429DRAFT_3714 PE=4 SV=1: DUF4132 [Gemmataceae bacterium]VTU00293.1 heat repeat-containing protein : Uncharacterized protein OS=Pseudanabaena biceps PCC 7429 GN=Pse7429DRAFT_3714 PE=4 SV=1: DUF4132 [Gemmataceae bacterium]
MLKPDLARQQLGKLTSKRHRQARIARVQKLPKPLAAAGLGVFGLLPTGSPPSDWSERRALEPASAAHLGGDPKGRAKVLAALFPTMHADVEAGWQLKGRVPYTAGHNRRGFRAPNRPEVYTPARQSYLESLFDELGDVPDDVLTAEWVAAWAVHLGYRTDEFGALLAGVIDAGGPAAEGVLTTLKDCAANRHEIGGPGAHAIRGLLCSARTDAWEFCENLLLAAQRQEGLRQTILEAVDEAHPGAFRRMVALVLDQNLVRFASVARAVGVWFGEEEAVEDAKKLKADLQACRDLLGNPAARKKAVEKGDAATAYRGLWAMAHEDAEVAVKAATPLLKDKDAARRFAAVKLIDESGLPEAAHLLLPLLADPDLRVLSSVLNFYSSASRDADDAGAQVPKDLFERLEKVVPKLPEKSKELKPLVPHWPVMDLSQEDAADLLTDYLGTRPAERLLPHLPAMSDYRRVQALAKLCEPRTLTTKVRQTLLAIAGEPYRYVREAALKYLKKSKLAEDEVRTLEGYLTRKTADFRRGVFGLLLNRPDKLVVGTIDRLLAAGDANQRAAGIELARRMVDGERMAEPVRERLRDYREVKGKRLTAAEAAAIEIVLNPASRPPTLEDGLGLFDPADRTPAIEPEERKVKFVTPAAIAFLTELDEFIHEHRDATFLDARNKNAPEEKVLGSVQYRWHFPGTDETLTAEQDRANLPLLDLWDGWWKYRSARTRDADGFELLRAITMPTVEVREGEEDADWDDDDDDDLRGKKPSPVQVAYRKFREQIVHPEPVRLRYEDLISQLLDWFAKLYRPSGASDFLLDAAESVLALVPRIVIDQTPLAAAGGEGTDEDGGGDDDDVSVIEWREDDALQTWLRLAAANQEAAAPDWTPEHDARLFRLERWRDEPVPGARRLRPHLSHLLPAYAAGAATLADVMDHLIGPRPRERWGTSFDSLEALTSPDADTVCPVFASRPELKQAVNEVVARVIEVELNRGETPSAATRAANDIKQIFGRATLFELIAALGKHGFGKTARWGASENKPAVLTGLIQKCLPLPADTPAAFAAAAKEAVAAGLFESERVVELGLVNPRWVEHAAAAVGWPGYAEAVYWFMAHTENRWEGEFSSDEDDTDDTPAGEKAKPDTQWQTILKARTNLTAEQRADGLIDVAWFHKAYAEVGSAARWDAIEAAAKFLGYGQAHKKAARLADVLLGKTKKKDLVQAVRTKYLKEAVRHLGLLPLPEDPAKRDAELADRYKVLKEYERYARGLSSLSKEPAIQAARLGMENLAVTAGFADPVRLEWAVTAREVADLVKGPVTVSAKDAAATLTLTADGDADLSFTKGGKPAKALPADAKKSPKVAELLDRKKNLSRIAASTKRSLEQAMCAGDRFRAAELKALMEHPLVRPLLERLVLKTPAGMGYPAKGGASLKGWDGTSVAVGAADEWTVAHPLDLLDAGDWHEWQGECFRAERSQPFKQVFREVYVPTAAEAEDGDKSRRYSGHQVNEQQSDALFAARGWSTRDGISKLFRGANLVASVEFDHGYSTPGDAAAPAVREAVFHRRGDWETLPLAEVPKKIFSEVMRDLDLVVSVAHVGGVDPEATQSTVAMRADLVRETCRLLKLGNVKLDSKHALIEGGYGRYSVHLGSGVVHKQPGGALCVVPVNAQHRGRLFLPFADDDPRTAEMVSKVLLLARDTEIQDPSILSQIAAK